MARIKVSFVVTAVVLVAVLAGCSSSKDTSSSTSSTAASGVTVASSSNTVNVSFADSGTQEGGPMTMTVAPATVKAGKVTFNVTNTGKVEHEVVVVKLPAGAAYDKLPVATSGETLGKVAEDGNVGEVEVQPGAREAFTIDNLEAGSYVLVDNLFANGYTNGGRALLTAS